TVIVEEDGERLWGGVEYAMDLWERESVERMLGHWQRLLESVVEDPERRLRGLGMLGGAERQQLLEEWNDTAAPYPTECLYELFEAQAERTPDAVAVVFEDASLSYGELNRRANRLGHYLHNLGVGPEVRVGICLERSLEMMISVLGALKAGGAYVPLDPGYPLERLSYMEEDAGIGVLLTHSRVAERLPGGWSQLVKLDEEEWMAEEGERGPETGILAENLAYVIYTSGSTGSPKGVGVRHGGGANLARAQREAFGLA